MKIHKNVGLWSSNDRCYEEDSMDTERLIGSDLILLLLVAPTHHAQAVNRINGITRLEKLLFLIEQEWDYESYVDERFNFIAYNYGPYSKEVYETVDILKQAGLVEEERKITDSVLDNAEELLCSVQQPKFRMNDSSS